MGGHQDRVRCADFGVTKANVIDGDEDEDPRPEPEPIESTDPEPVLKRPTGKPPSRPDR